MSNRFPFSRVRIAKLDPTDKAVRFYDERQPGLFLVVTPGGTKTFYLMYSSPSHQADTSAGKRRKSRQLKLGRFPTLSVEDARTAASRALGLVAQGLDPLDVRQSQLTELAADAARVKRASEWTLRFQLNNESSAWRLYTRRERLKRTEDTVAILQHHFGEWLDQSMLSITRQELQDWIDRQLAAGKSPGGVNRPLNYLSSVYKQCRMQDPNFGANPFVGLQKPKEPKEHIRYLEDAERESLLNALRNAPEYMQVLVKLALSTGMRRDEMLTARWSQLVRVDSRTYLRLIDTKNRTDHDVPIPGEMMKVLLGWKLKNGLQETDYLFPSPRVRGVRLSSIQKQWASLLAEAGITRLRFHDLRHEFATKALEEGMPPTTLQRILNHADLKTTLRYSHIRDSKMHDAVDRIASKDLF